MKILIVHYCSRIRRYRMEWIGWCSGSIRREPAAKELDVSEALDVSVITEALRT